MAKIGGLHPRNVAFNIAKFVFTKEFGKKVSWWGRKGNIPLKETPIGLAMLGKKKKKNLLVTFILFILFFGSIFIRWCHSL